MSLICNWQPAVSPEVLRLRAQLLAEVRRFFANHGVLEVETPILSTAGTTDPQLDSFITAYRGPGSSHTQALYLHTSPEFPMKRLLAMGSGCIYQITKVFRNGEVGRFHNPEFTLLEWYRLGFDHHRLMDEVEELATALLYKRLKLKASERLSYSEVFQRYLGLDPHRTCVPELAACVRFQGLTPPAGMPPDDPNPWLDLLLSHRIGPQLGQGKLTFVYDYPASQAALARVNNAGPPLAERFELYLKGIELANGFHELGDTQEQRDRFDRDNHIRTTHGLPLVPIDENLLAALAAGLPDCAGVALGFDRLLMIAADKPSLAEVIAFPIDRK
jgi:lysyl-tRNA synthetase class 2